VSARTLEETVLNFRKNLQVRIQGDFIFQARQLYQWLIFPVLDTLRSQAIDTIVIVPDSLLRTVPLAALHDGERFLIEEFALATTPGLNLTDPRPLPRQNSSILLNGLSESVQNFSPLPNVPQEINHISALFQNKDILLDKTFLFDNFSKLLEKKPYSIVHIASHGEFDRNPEKTFLLTYEDKLTLNRLENVLGFSEMRESPVELLTLSACETAVGDEQAALGLAGVAIKAGARSAVASLWFVNDEATSQLIIEFYTQLKNPALSKAQALQKAQQKFLNHPWFRHPSYWSSFLLIGNWL
jgi:CHAT domain-containing protein